MFHFHMKKGFKDEDYALPGLTVFFGKLPSMTSLKVPCIFKKSFPKTGVKKRWF